MVNKFHVLLLNGPNLNLLGTRECEIYGSTTLSEVVTNLLHYASQHNIQFSHLQSNSESQLINRIHESLNNVDYIIINPAALTHTSISLRDALLAVSIPFIEVHITNLHTRESFRHHSYLTEISSGIICGLGIDGYMLALQTVAKRLSYFNKKEHGTYIHGHS